MKRVRDMAGVRVGGGRAASPAERTQARGRCARGGAGGVSLAMPCRRSPAATPAPRRGAMSRRAAAVRLVAPFAVAAALLAACSRSANRLVDEATVAGVDTAAPARGLSVAPA